MTRPDSEQILKFNRGDVFDNIDRWIRLNKGSQIALITTVNIDGRSPYPVGTQMAVNANGNYCGYLTSGCAEKAILTHALAQIPLNKISIERYGKESQYFDIVLPCGSGIDVLIDPTIETTFFEHIISLKRKRKTFAIKTLIHTSHHECIPSKNIQYDTHLSDTYFYHLSKPTPKLIIAGQGPILSALVETALRSGFCVDAYFDDDQFISEHINSRLNLFPSQQLKSSLENEIDEHTGFISLFHEHDKEILLLERVLKSSVFYIGALGSRTSHQNRINALKNLGVDEAEIAKIHGPIGLPIEAKTPEHIAVSILAEIISTLP